MKRGGEEQVDGMRFVAQKNFRHPGRTTIDCPGIDGAGRLNDDLVLCSNQQSIELVTDEWRRALLEVGKEQGRESLDGAGEIGVVCVSVMRDWRRDQGLMEGGVGLLGVFYDLTNR